MLIFTGINKIYNTLEAIRKVIKINNNQLNITLPIGYNYKYVEVIILPYNKKEKETKTKDLTDLQKLLLSTPVMTDEDYDFYLEKTR